jgi:tetratricopeptide (TPR) repeat protein
LESKIDDLLIKLISEDQPRRWIVIVYEIVKRFGSTATSHILKAIKNDPQKETDEISSTKNSQKWNSLGGAYLQNGLIEDAIKIFKELISQEPNNPATQNNYGIVLSNIDRFSEAEQLFYSAYKTDKRLDPKLAKKMPAYKNLMLLKAGKRRPGEMEKKTFPSYHNIFFMDIVGFSRPSWYATVQLEKINCLTDITRTLLGRLGLNYMKVPMLPTGDGMALFFESPEHPIKLAIELTRELEKYNKTMSNDMKIELRIGIHSGYSFEVPDLHKRGNRCGPAINTARRVMDLGQARHILSTYEYGNELKRLYGSTGKYGSLLHDCEKYTVKHGEEINIYNIFNKRFGNSNCPNH